MLDKLTANRSFIQRNKPQGNQQEPKRYVEVILQEELLFKMKDSSGLLFINDNSEEL